MAQPTLWNGIDPEETGGAYRKDGPENSLKAARSVKSGSWHAFIVDTLLSVYPEGLTARNISDYSLDSGKGHLTPEKANTRIKELRDRGYVDFVYDENTQLPTEAPTTEGNTGRLNKLTRTGYNEALSLHAQRIAGVGQ